MLIIVVGDTPSSVEINALGSHWGPIQDGGHALGTHPIWWWRTGDPSNMAAAHWGPIQDGGRALGTHPRWRPR